MAIDVAQHIRELLYEHDTLVIPGIGGIIADYKSATIDRVQGLIQPPSKKLSFNENLVINDGVLLEHIYQQHQISRKEAEQIITDFSERVRLQLDNREIVNFPQVGRLYKNYENSLQFLQDTTNFNTEVYGLPVLQFYPILRAKEPAYTRMEEPRRPVKKDWTRQLRPLATAALPVIIGIIIIGTAYGIFQNRSALTDQEEGIAKTLPVENRINKKPSQQQEMSLGSVLQPEEENTLDDVTENPLDTESPTMTPETKACIIIVGAFSKKAGVKRRVREIIDLGYSPYQDKKGHLTRVGIQFGYEGDEEVLEKLNAMRDLFDTRAWVLEE